MLSYKVIIKGRRLDVAVLTEGDGSECLEFIENLARVKRNKIKAAMKYLADEGKISIKDIYKKLDNNIWEFRYSDARVYCFRDQNTVVCTHGAYKTKRRRTSVEISRADRLRRQYLGR